MNYNLPLFNFYIGYVITPYSNHFSVIITLDFITRHWRRQSSDSTQPVPLSGALRATLRRLQVATQADLVDNCSQYTGCQETILEIHGSHLEAEQAAQMWACAHKPRSKDQGPHHLASMPQAAGP